MLALALAGCGKKGALDAPPSAAIEQPGETPQKQANHPANQAQPKQHFILDWLID